MVPRVNEQNGRASYRVYWDPRYSLDGVVHRLYAPALLDEIESVVRRHPLYRDIRRLVHDEMGGGMTDKAA